MSKFYVEEKELQNIADGIRLKAGINDRLSFPNDFISVISSLGSGGGLPETSEYTEIGIVTPTEATNDLTVDYHMSATPIGVAYMALEAPKVAYTALTGDSGNTSQMAIGYNGNIRTASQWVVSTIDTENKQVHLKSATTYKLRPGVPYLYVIWAYNVAMVLSDEEE